jgi:hypothetical protein
MVISHKKKFIFIHNYKVAGTSITYALKSYSHTNLYLRLNDLLFKKVGFRVNIPHPRLRHIPVHTSASELHKFFPKRIIDEYLVFSFVRNPWDWQVSLYFYMLQNPKHKQHEIINRMSFEEYVYWRVDEDLHLQKEFLVNEDNQVVADFVGRFEHLEKDFSVLCDYLSIKAELPHHNPSRHQDYRSYYSTETREIISEAFQEDIKLFGYSFDGPTAGELRLGKLL